MTFFTAEQAAKAAASTVRMAWLAKFDFLSDTVRIWAGNRRVTLASQVWLPTFGEVKIDGLGWTGDTSSKQLTMELSGVDDAFLSAVLAETGEVDQRPLTIYLHLFDEDWQPDGGLIPIFLGLMQPPEMSRTEGENPKQTVHLVAENLMFNRAKPPFGRYSDRDQNNRTTGDKFFEFTPSLLSKMIVWPDF